MITDATTSEALSGRGGTSTTLRATNLWLFDTEFDLALGASIDDPRALLLASAAASCFPLLDRRTALDRAALDRVAAGRADAVEQALRRLATSLGVAADPALHLATRRAVFLTGAPQRGVTSVDDGRNGITVTTRGAIATVLPHCTRFLDDQGRGVPLTLEARTGLDRAVARYTAEGYRVLAVGHRALGVGRPAPADQQDAESDLVLLGLIAVADRTAHPATI